MSINEQATAQTEPYLIDWTHWFCLGHKFNYPLCCIEYFCLNMDRSYAALSVHRGTGFIPCPECLAKEPNNRINKSADDLTQGL